jgi:hypothetical protein
MLASNTPIRPSRASRLIPILVAAVVIPLATNANGETWTNLQGTHSVEAEMVGMWADNVVLKMIDGRRVTVKLGDLKSESRIQAQALSKQISNSRAGRVKELQGQAAAAAAPAPNPLPQPPPAAAYVAPKQDAKVGDFLQQFDDALVKGHIVAVYDSLPPSYRSDVNEIVKLGAQKINPATWQTLVGTLQQLGDVIVTRQRWFLSSPRIENLPPEQYDRIADQVLTFAGMLRDGLSPDAMQLEKLQSMDFGQWLAERDRAVAPHLAQWFNRNADSIREFTVDSEKNGIANVSIVQGAESSKVVFTMVEGYWVPKTLADRWTETVDSHKKQIAETADGSMLATVGLMLQPIAAEMGQLLAATDASRFHQAMESALVPTETLANGIAAMMGTNMNLASRGRGGSGPGGYEDEMGYEEDMYGDEDMEGMEDEEMEMEMEMEDEPGAP